MASVNVVEEQRYSSFDSRDSWLNVVMQTELPEEVWPPPSLPPTQTQRQVFTIDTGQSQPVSSQSSCCINKDAYITFLLVVCCMISSVVSLGLLGYSGWTGLEIYNFKADLEDTSMSDSWKYTDETTLCVSLSGRDLHHSGCAKYLFHDISENENYTCCVRDSSQYSFLYQLIYQEQTRITSAVKNTICTHSSAMTKVLSNGTLVWRPVTKCELNGKSSSTSLIGISSSKMYFVYLSFSIRFEKTYRILKYHKIRVRLFRRHFNTTNGDDFHDEELLHKMMEVRKEFQNFENIFMYEQFYLSKGDKLFVEVQNSRFLYNYEQGSNFGIVKLFDRQSVD